MVPKNSGAVAISTILIIGAIVAEIAIASLITSYLLGQGGLGVRLVYNASFVAQSGIEDALMKITRNKDTNSVNSYAVVVGNATALVTLCKKLTASTGSCDTPELPDGTFDVISLGTALNKQVRMEALLYSDPTTGLVTIQSLREIST